MKFLDQAKMTEDEAARRLQSFWRLRMMQSRLQEMMEENMGVEKTHMVLMVLVRDDPQADIMRVKATMQGSLVLRLTFLFKKDNRSTGSIQVDMLGQRLDMDIAELKMKVH